MSAEIGGLALQIAWVSVQPNQEIVVQLGHLRELIEASCASVSRNRVDELQAALEDRLASGDTDTDVAVRHGVPREYICRARRSLQRELFTA